MLPIQRQLPPAIESGAAGLRSASDRMDAAARRIGAGTGERVDDAVAMKLAERDFHASAAVVRAARRADESAIDLLA